MKTLRKTPRFKHVWLWLGAFILPICAGASQGDFYPSYEAKIVGHCGFVGETNTSNVLAARRPKSIPVCAAGFSARLHGF